MSCEHSIVLSLSLFRSASDAKPIPSPPPSARHLTEQRQETTPALGAPRSVPRCLATRQPLAAGEAKSPLEFVKACRDIDLLQPGTTHHPFFILLKVQVQTSQKQRKQLSIGFTRHAFLFAMYHCEYWRPSQILHWYRFLPSSSKRSLTRTSCRKVSALWWKKSCIIRDWGVSVFAIAALETWHEFHLATLPSNKKKNSSLGQRGWDQSWDVCIPFLSIPSPRWPKSLPPLAHRHEQRAGKPQRSWNAWVSQLNPYNSLKLLKIWNPRFESWILRIPKSLSGWSHSNRNAHKGSQTTYEEQEASTWATSKRKKRGMNYI